MLRIEAVPNHPTADEERRYQNYCQQTSSLFSKMLTSKTEVEMTSFQWHYDEAVRLYALGFDLQTVN